MFKLFTVLFILLHAVSYAQNFVDFKQNDKKTAFSGENELNYNVRLKKGEVYLIKVYQENIDIEINLYDEAGEKILSTDLADGNKGTDKLEYEPAKGGLYKINIKSVSPKPSPDGTISMNFARLSKSVLERRRKIAKALEPENAKDVSTIDIKHFWEAFDALKAAKTYGDSVNIIQSKYLDRATNGLKEFAKVRYFSPEFYTDRIRKYKKFYESVRQNTLLFSDSERLSDIIRQTRSLYPNGKEAKIAITIGPMSSGGTISNNYVLIGLEMIAGDKNCDVSEITNENLRSDILARSDQADVLNFVRETIAHEYIHTQQRKMNQTACECVLLENVIKEGVASFISEVLIKKRNQETGSRASLYATAHEKELWQEMKSELCTKNLQNWLFNAASSKNRPGDLGYRIGYKIAESFYNKSDDKKMAIKEMIETDNPLVFLDKSEYDLKFR
ncbi:DUF2268 domain-containing putative Zn-dependent protease [uncultured Pedobacter sp.]|uniref:gliding motility protein GldB-related protein n=1 Tax=uncultured Pedobacter sp. TaxID=246139 RepID=UPI0025FDA9A2|nr:DUF2268 domain-containing putative Zn-dependent protease [uncultured Pedobacter sp.]